MYFSSEIYEEDEEDGVKNPMAAAKEMKEAMSSGGVDAMASVGAQSAAKLGGMIGKGVGGFAGKAFGSFFWTNHFQIVASKIQILSSSTKRKDVGPLLCFELFFLVWNIQSIIGQFFAHCEIDFIVQYVLIILWNNLTN